MQRITDLISGFFWTCVAVMASALVVTVFAWLIWIFVSVIYLGESSSCPQNLC